MGMDFSVHVGPYALCKNKKKITREAIYYNSCDCDDTLKHIEGNYCSICGQKARSISIFSSGLWEEVEKMGERITSCGDRSDIWRSNIGGSWAEQSFNEYSDDDYLDLDWDSVKDSMLEFERQHYEDIKLLKKYFNSVEIKYGAYSVYS